MLNPISPLDARHNALTLHQKSPEFLRERDVNNQSTNLSVHRNHGRIQMVNCTQTLTERRSLLHSLNNSFEPL